MKKTNKLLAFRLKHQIIFLENTVTNPLELERWQEKLKTFAEIIPISESNFAVLENLNFGHMITEGYFLFRIRFLIEININLRISFKNRNFEIKRIININEQNRLLQIVALEI